jgi:hypothetical protein
VTAATATEETTTVLGLSVQLQHQDTHQFEELLVEGADIGKEGRA